MDNLKLFGKRIKELRKNANLTQEQLAEKLGLYPKQIGNIETGTCFTTMSTLEKLSKQFNVEIADLFNFTQENSREILINELTSIIKNLPENNLKLAYKIIKSINK